MDATQLPLFNPLGLLAWLPDETFFSLCSRYDAIWSTSSRRTSSVLTGCLKGGAPHDVPKGLDYFAATTGFALGEPADLIYSRTIAPFFFPFYPLDRATLLTNAMRGQRLGNAKASFGLLGARFGALHPLKACPSCMASDEARYHVAYWHRAHQTPATWLCRVHHEPLMIAAIGARNISPYDWCLPRSVALRPVCGAPDFRRASPALTSLAGMSDCVLDLPRTFRFDLAQLRNAFRAAMAARNLLTRKGNLRLTAAAEIYLAEIEPLAAIPHLGALAPDAASIVDHLGRLFRTGDRCPHPMRWLSLAHVFFDDWDSFVRTYLQAGAEAPAKAHGVGEERTVRMRGFRDKIEAGLPISQAANQSQLSPGAARSLYIKLGFDPAPVLKNLSTKQRRNIANLLSQGRTRSAIAKQLRIDRALVGYAALATPNAVAAGAKPSLDSARARNRAAIVTALERTPTISRSQLRIENVAAYSWLQKHDQDWLFGRLPPKQQSGASPRRRVNRHQLDLRLSRAIRALPLEGTRLPLWRAKREVFGLAANLKHLPSLPMTLSALLAASALSRKPAT